MSRSTRLAFIAGLLACAAVVRPAAAQSVGVIVGSTGIGAEVGYDLGPSFAVRATGTYFTYSHDFGLGHVTYDGHLRLLSFGLLGDAYLFGSGFRLTGGAMLDRNRLNMTGNSAATVTIGNDVYTASQLGTLNGQLRFRDFAPYAGFGYAGKRGEKGFAFTADAGVMFAGTPRVILVATGPIATDPTFLADVARERQRIQDGADLLRFYPVLRLGLLYRF